MAGPMWLTICYFLQTLGELSLSPVGLSAMTKLAPARAAGFHDGDLVSVDQHRRVALR